MFHALKPLETECTALFLISRGDVVLNDVLIDTPTATYLLRLKGTSLMLKRRAVEVLIENHVTSTLLQENSLLSLQSPRFFELFVKSARENPTWAMQTFNPNDFLWPLFCASDRKMLEWLFNAVPTERLAKLCKSYENIAHITDMNAVCLLHEKGMLPNPQPFDMEYMDMKKAVELKTYLKHHGIEVQPRKRKSD